MTNEQQSELISAYLDGELTAAERAQVEQLLTANPRARQLLEELRALSVTLKSLPAEKLGEDLSESVLRIAQRRMLTEAATAEAPAVPLSKSILRRLKNPRIWAWQVVIITVALLLFMYYPQQPPPPAGPAPREIALGPKAGEDQIVMEKAPAVQPAPTEVAGDRFERAIVTKDIAEMEPAAERPLGKEGIAARRAPGISMQSTSENSDRLISPKSAEPSAPMSGKSALAQAGEAKKDWSDLKYKIADKDLPQDVFQTEAKGAGTVAGKAGQPPAAANQAPAEAQTTVGGSQLAEIQADKKPLSKAEAIRLFTQTDAAKAAGGAANQPLIVYCDVTREAVDNHALDKLLTANQIVLSQAPAQNLADDKINQREKLQSLLDEEAARKAIQPERPSRSAGARDNHGALQAGTRKAGSFEIVYVEAAPAQIQATIAGITSQSHAFHAVSVTEAKDSSWFANLNLDENRNKEEIDTFRGLPAQTPQLEEQAKIQTQATSTVTSPASRAPILGRAYSYGYYFDDGRGEVAAEKFDRRRQLADTTQPALPPATPASPAPTDRAGKSAAGFGGALAFDSSAGVNAQQQLPAQKQNLSLSQQTQEVQNAPAAAMAPSTSTALGQMAQPKTGDQTAQIQQSVERYSTTTPAAPAASPLLQRALFVLRVVDEKNSAEQPHAATDADVAPPAATKAKQ